MPHGALDLTEIKRRVGLHIEFDALGVARQALDHDVLKLPVRNRFSHVLHLVPKEGGAEGVLVRILPGLHGRGHEFRRFASISLICSGHILGV